LPWASTKHHPSTSQVIKHHDAISQHEWVVVGERIYTRTQLDVFGSFGSGSNHDFRRSDQFRPSRVVFADPGFVISEFIEVLKEFEVTLQSKSGVDTRLVHGRHEDSEAKTHVKLLTHSASLNRAVRTHRAC
jgi:hypothetical protein